MTAAQAHADFAPPGGRPVIMPGLARMRAALDRLGQPQRRLPPVIHVAGTNGKGSTIAFLRAMIEAAGGRVHAYTSPHLLDIRECVRLAVAPGRSALIDDAALAELLTRIDAIAPAGDPLRPTPFEALTLSALLAFAATPADVLLLETGMGGGADATNVVDQPAAAVITRISFDHMAFLGDRLGDIAAAKAGVIKPGVPVIVAPQGDATATAVIAARAAALDAPLRLAGRDWRAYAGGAEGAGMTYADETGMTLNLPAPALAGAHQIDNAGTAIAALTAALPHWATPETIAAGLGAVRWPGRLQRLADLDGMQIWADGGHNDSGAAALADWAAQHAPLGLAVGMLGDKDAAAFLRPLAPYVRRLVAVPIRYAPRPAYAPADLAALGRQAGVAHVEVADDPAAALARLAAAGCGCALVCGSLHLLPEVLPPGCLTEA